MTDNLSKTKPERIERAIAKLIAQIASSPQSADIYLELGDLYAIQERWQQAKDTYRQALTLKSDCAEAHRRLATIFTKLDNSSQSANHSFKAFQLQPDAVSAKQHYQLGQTLQKQDKPAMAIACYRRAIELQPDFWLAYRTLFALLKQQGKQNRALEVYRQGTKHNPQDWRYYFALASALAASQNWARASNNYQRAAELKPSTEVYYHWGLTLNQLQEYGAAESCFQQAIALQADYKPASLELDKLERERQQGRQAIAEYQKVIASNPRDGMALFNLGRAHLRLEQWDLALNCFHQALNFIADSSIETVIAEYQKALTRHPQPAAKLYYQLGKLLRAKSRFFEAICAYQKSIEIDPYFENAYIDLQYTPIDETKSLELIEFYRQIVAKYPDLAIAWGNLGDGLTQQDRVAEAIDCYSTASYQQAIKNYPNLAKLNWPPQKETGPDFIIAGASKCGTSSIYHYLSCHPQILLSHKKELDFYWQNYHHGIDWYLAHFPTICDRSDFLTGEATPNYLRFPQVAQRIKDTFPKTKIIILLRNPVDRAISWHYHKLNAGLTDIDLATAIATEIERLATVTEAEITNTGYYNPDNIMSSLYIYKIEPWIELLGREQFLILKSEEFYNHPLQIMTDVFEFLDLPNCPLNNYPKVNAGSYQPIDSQLRKIIANYFAPYNRQLEEYLGMKFDWE